MEWEEALPRGRGEHEVAPFAPQADRVWSEV